jgi:hypothetical protein
VGSARVGLQGEEARIEYEPGQVAGTPEAVETAAVQDQVIQAEPALPVRSDLSGLSVRLRRGRKRGEDRAGAEAREDQPPSGVGLGRQSANLPWPSNRATLARRCGRAV